MIFMTNQNKLSLYTSIFRGRSDVYPRRWEKGDKSGWSPAYSFDWNEFNAHRARGGTMKDFDHKTLCIVTDEVILNHLLGKETIGIYPILTDNTSYFIAADFDEGDWENDVQKFIAVCNSFSLQAYAEISRSGNGAHAWVFFEKSYQCFKSRAIMLEMIRKTFNHSPFVKEASFDRLFPNQDTITDGGFGNLIALPLQGERVVHNASVFCELEKFTPYTNQWEFLKRIHKHSQEELDAVYETLFDNKDSMTSETQTGNNQVHILVDGLLHLKKSELPPTAVIFIKDNLNIFNKEFTTKRRLGMTVFGIEQYFSLIHDEGGEVTLPRGFLDDLKTFLDENNISYSVVYNYKEHETASYKSIISLREEQSSLLDEIMNHTNGIIIAPPGSGKTIMALELISRLNVPALILVNRNQLLSQWVERTEQFLGISKINIGTISGTKKKIGKQVTVATLQSLVRYKNLQEVTDSFGIIIVDECHHIPAKTYRNLISSFKSKYFFGLTATHARKFGSEKITELIIGPVIAEMKETDTDSKKLFDVSIHATQLSIPFRYTTDHYETLAKTICYDSARNELITKVIVEEALLSRKILVLTERKEHLEMLKLYLGGKVELIAISGDDSLRSRKVKLDQIEAGNFKVLLTTGQLLGEGFDLHGVDSIVLAFPFSFEGKLKQYIGRLRSKGLKHIIDFLDEKVSFLERQYKKRKTFYKKEFGFSVTL